MSKSGRKHARPQSRRPARAAAAPAAGRRPIHTATPSPSAPAVDLRNDLPQTAEQTQSEPFSRIEVWTGAAARGLPTAITLYMLYIGAITLGKSAAAVLAILFAVFGGIASAAPKWTKNALLEEWIGALNIFRYSLFFAALGLLAWISWSLSHIALVSIFAAICFAGSAVVCVAAQRYTILAAWRNQNSSGDTK